MKEEDRVVHLVMYSPGEGVLYSCLHSIDSKHLRGQVQTNQGLIPILVDGAALNPKTEQFSKETQHPKYFLRNEH